MIEQDTLLIFALSSFLLIICPGPNMIYIITKSISRGKKTGLLAAFGVDIGTLIHVLGAILGLASLLATFPGAYAIIRYLGAGYFMYLAYRNWAHADDMEIINIDRSGFQNNSLVLIQGMAVNLLNPKVILFFVAFLPQFTVPKRGHISLQLFVLGLIFTSIALTLDILVVLFSSLIRNWLHEKAGATRNMRILSAGIYFLLGIYCIIFF